MFFTVTQVLFARWLGEKYSMEYKNKMKLTSYQFEAIIGLMLGDLYAERNKPTHNTRLIFEQSKSEHESYLLFLYSIFKDIVGTEPKPPKRKPHPVTGKIYISLTFKTLKFSFLNIFHELFYNTGIKSIPQNISDLFTSISLAFWIMDDGMKAGEGLRLCTESFQYSEILILTKMLKTKFNIESKPQKRGSNKWRIYIGKAQMPLLREIVKPYIHSDMLFKIGL